MQNMRKQDAGTCVRPTADAVSYESWWSYPEKGGAKQGLNRFVTLLPWQGSRTDTKLTSVAKWRVCKLTRELPDTRKFTREPPALVFRDVSWLPSFSLVCRPVRNPSGFQAALVRILDDLFILISYHTHTYICEIFLINISCINIYKYIWTYRLCGSQHKKI